jgi:hypothetical protein
MHTAFVRGSFERIERRSPTGQEARDSDPRPHGQRPRQRRSATEQGMGSLGLECDQCPA